MHDHIAPRHFTPGAGMPSDRGARLAARQAFVSLKLTFLQVLDGIAEPGSPASTALPLYLQSAADDGCNTRLSRHLDWLRTQVRAAEEPVDLWLLRAPVFAVLSDADCRARRQLLRRGLDSMFPDLDGPASHSAFMPF